MSKEIWKNIYDYEGLYQISNFGRVKSLAGSGITLKKFKSIRKEKILKSSNSLVQIYFTVALVKNKTPKTKYIHRLMATAFIPNPKNKRTVNHKNGIKTDNGLENLEWMTYKENINHAWDNGKCTPHGVMGEESIKSKLKEKQVIEIKKYLNNGYTIISLSELYNVSMGAISAIKYNKSWKHILK